MAQEQPEEMAVVAAEADVSADGVGGKRMLSSEGGDGGDTHRPRLEEADKNAEKAAEVLNNLQPLERDDRHGRDDGRGPREDADVRREVGNRDNWRHEGWGLPSRGTYEKGGSQNRGFGWAGGKGHGWNQRQESASTGWGSPYATYESTGRQPGGAGTSNPEGPRAYAQTKPPSPTYSPSRIRKW